jgi:hypothetical protein
MIELNQGVTMPESCIKQTLNKVPIYKMFASVTCINQTPVFRTQKLVPKMFGILVYSGFGLDRFIQDSGLFMVWFRQVYTGFWFIQDLV